ncbi:nucleotide excision repair endonuclease [Heyndrickxia vini]|uniref:Nucleotide excision repair endonuclease n=1 Tax=Heyndrickxia vini TaxID=1476025 RepID=A0ABX7E7U4_9BACI|nr:nucleotide excision repair endonuclease [Heyndrickxia vini]QQZ11321.1 nucleotide excision repair endonuclease [Heyndrickxia vini]
MIKIDIPKADVIITKKKPLEDVKDHKISSEYGFTEFRQISREKGGIILFYNDKDELLFVGKARKLRQRVTKHFDDNVSAIKKHRDEVQKIAVVYVENPMEREIYETYIINKFQAKYNIDKVFYK